MSAILAVARGTFREAVRDRVLFLVVGVRQRRCWCSRASSSPIALGEGSRDHDRPRAVDRSASRHRDRRARRHGPRPQGDRAPHDPRRAVAAGQPRVVPGRQVGGPHGDHGRGRVARWASSCVVASRSTCAARRPSGRCCRRCSCSRSPTRVLAALAVLFSSLSTPVLSVVYTLGLYATGYWTSDLRDFARAMPGALGQVVRGASYVIPNLDLFNLRPQVAHVEAAPTRAARARARLRGVPTSTAVLALGGRRVRAAGAQVKPRLPADRAQSCSAIVLALAVFVLCRGAGGRRRRAWAIAHLSRAEPLAELAYYPSGTWLGQAALGERDGVVRSPVAARGAVLRAPPRDRQHVRPDGATCSTSSPTLDPHFQNAYVFGGTSLCQEGRQFDAGVRLLEKGQLNNPTAWVYPFELGFVHYLGKRNLTRATFEFAQAARQPNSPDYCQRFAAWSGQRAGYEAVVGRAVAPGRGDDRQRGPAREGDASTCASSSRARRQEQRARGLGRTLKPLAGSRRSRRRPPARLRWRNSS